MSTPTEALALQVIELACRAPSVHNSQPWRWRVVDASTIDLYADRDRQLPVSDPSGRNLAISCGAAVHHCFVAAQGLSLAPKVDLLPSPDDNDHLARITLSPGVQTDETQKSLLALESRCTDRRRFTSWPVPDSRLAHLATAASGWGAHVMPITDVTDRFRAERLLERARDVQGADPAYAEELSKWIDHSQADGVPMANATPTQGRPSTRPNRFATDAETADTAAAAANQVESSDGLVAICSGADNQAAWLATGQTLSALWLRATHDGLAIVPLSQAIEVDETREALHESVFDGMARPQILVRVGWLETARAPLARSPRRPVAEVLES